MQISTSNLIRIITGSFLAGMIATMFLRGLTKWIWRIILIGGLLLLLSKLISH